MITKSRILSLCPHVSRYFWKRRFFPRFKNVRSASTRSIFKSSLLIVRRSTRSVFKSSLLIHTKTLKRCKYHSFPYSTLTDCELYDGWHHCVRKPPFSSLQKTTIIYRFQKSPPRGPFSKPALLVPKHAVCMWMERLKREKKNNLCFQNIRIRVDRAWGRIIIDYKQYVRILNVQRKRKDICN